MDKINHEMRDQLKKVLEEGLSDDAMKSIKKKVDGIICTIDDDVMYRLKDDLAPNISAWVAKLAEDAIEQLLAGNEEMMRRYLKCDIGAWSFTGRSDGYGTREIDRQHPVIHGLLHENMCVALRANIVNAHRELLVNERIKDLEDEVKSLVAQVNRANAEKNEMWERTRHLA